MRSWPLTLLLGLATAAAPRAAVARPPAQSAPEEGARLEATPLFGGQHDAGRWAAVHLSLAQGATLDEAVVVEARVDGHRLAATAVELPRGSRKEALLLLPLGQLGDHGDAEISQSVELWMSRDGDPASAAQVVTLRSTGGQPLIVLASSDGASPGHLAALTGGSGGRLVTEAPDRLPDQALAYASVDHLALAGVDWRSLSAGQQLAIRQWVGLGGHLIVAGGPSSARTLGHLPPEMSPSEILGTRQAEDLGALQAITGQPAPTGSLALAELAPDEGAIVLLSLSDGSAVAARGRYGDGRVTLLAADPFAEPLAGWAGEEALWSFLGSEFPLPDTAWSQPAPNVRLLQASLDVHRGARLPPMPLLATWLLAYLVVIGPLNYLVLRRLGRLDLAWLTIPAASVLTGLAVYAMGVRLHGQETRLDVLSVIRVVPEAGVAYVFSYLDLTAARSDDYELTLGQGAFRGAEGDLTIWPEGEPLPWQGREARLTGLRVAQWAHAGRMAEAVMPWPAAAIEPLQLRSNRIRSGLPNPFGRPVQAAALLVPGGSQWLGDLATGARLEADVAYDAFSGSQVSEAAFRIADPLTRAERIGLLQSIRQTEADGRSWPAPFGLQSPDPIDPALLTMPSFQRSDARLLAWDSAAAFPAGVSGTEARVRAVSLLDARLPIALGLADAHLLPGQVLRRSDESAVLCDGQSALLMRGEPAEFTFGLAMGAVPEGRVRLRLIDLGQRGDASSSYPFGDEAFPVRVSMWDGTTSGWVAVTVLPIGGSAELPRALDRSGGRSRLRLKLEADTTDPDAGERWEMFGGCVTPLVGVEGPASAGDGS